MPERPITEAVLAEHDALRAAARKPYWTPASVIHSARAAEVDYLVRVANDDAAMVARVRELEAALRTLVELEDGPRDGASRVAKPLAWERARATINPGAPDA